MLTVNDLHVHYGSIHAIKGVSFNVNEGEIVTLIGANGAGKTSILHAVSGLLKPSKGEVLYSNINLNLIKPHKIIQYGLAHVPEGRRVFSQLSVRENLELGAFIVKDSKQRMLDYNKVMQLFPRLKERENQLAGTLSGGEQQMLAMGRALMSSPKMLLLDEPSMGLSPILVKEIFTIVKECNKLGMTILLNEQNAKMALSIADKCYVLETGKVVLHGDAKDLLDNDIVKKAYLGG
ncbi:MAG: branched-chain amino acid abc transporter, ATP-binding protein [Bacillales bacterium]|jgi:branched-chain amino acid transport system ATP-binding protein|nr:branched-chain amino acid abc transporter, ATP-binding protein [Bacillales bacterium]